MADQYLDFELPFVELEQKINELKTISKREGVDFTNEIKKLHKKANKLKSATLLKLTRWQKTRLARHVNRPYTLDYIKYIMNDFIELKGDRCFGNGHSIVGGFARFEGKSLMVIGHQKGRDLKERMARNFGWSQPEGYRKALRLMKLAEKFGKPIITFLDTPGAYPGIGAEERGQAEAIARNLIEMASISVPIISIVIGEGGSGGALAIGIGNKVLMMENSIYSVISPEGCAAILWNDCNMLEVAADALHLTAQDLIKLNVIDEVLKEPLGGAHRDHEMSASILRRAIRRHLIELESMTPEQLVLQRREKFRNMGIFGGN